MEERQRMMEMMNVPDKIVVAGGDRYVGYQSDPRDAMGDIRVPETQTVYCLFYIYRKRIVYLSIWL